MAQKTLLTFDGVTYTLGQARWEVDLPSNGWSSNAITVQAKGINSNLAIVCSPIINDASSVDSINEAWSKIYKYTVGTDAITFNATEVPSITLKIMIAAV